MSSPLALNKPEKCFRRLGGGLGITKMRADPCVQLILGREQSVCCLLLANQLVKVLLHADMDDIAFPDSFLFQLILIARPCQL